MLLAGVARLLSGWLPPVLDPLNDVVIAVLLGIVVASAVDLPGHQAGFRLASTTLLQIGIVLLGFRLSLADIGQLGASTLLLILLTMTMAATVVWAVSRHTGLDGRQGALVAVGTAVCGNSAIAAAAPTIGASEDDVARAIAANTLVGTVALFTYPIVGHAVGATSITFGAWTGVAINDTAQVVAAGFAHSDLAGETATTVKLMRNALMAPALVVLALVFRRGNGERLSPTVVRKAVPGFVVLFLAAAGLTTLGVTARLDALVPVRLDLLALGGSRTVILVALSAVGMSTPISRFRRGGLAVIATAGLAGVAVAVLGFTLIVHLGLGPSGPLRKLLVV